MAVSISYVDTLLSLRDGFERFAIKTDEVGHSLEIELRHLLEAWGERVQKARLHERECQSDFDDAQRDLRWCQGRGDHENPPNCSYEQARLEKTRRALVGAQANLQLVSRSARELQKACEAFQQHGRALRQVATQTAPNASSRMNALLRDIENYSYITPASGGSSTSPSGSLSEAPPVEPSPRLHPVEPAKPSPSYQSRLSSSARELADLLRGSSAPTPLFDDTHIELAGQQLRSIAELAPDVWEHLSESQRVAALCSVERAMASLQGRAPVTIIVESEGHNVYGGYDPQADRISLNPSFVLGAREREMVEAIVHLGRHAYQAYAMRHPAFHSDLDEVGRWRINHLYYLSAELWGDEAHRNQPIERDAFAYAEAVIQQVYGDVP